MKIIIKNEIFFACHKVVCDPECANDDYLNEMAEEFDEDGAPEEHAEALERVNNDGSWSVVTPFLHSISDWVEGVTWHPGPPDFS